MTQEVPHRILLVDDEPAVLAGLRRLLRKEFQVHVASSGPQALEVLRAHGPFAVIVSDQYMPGMGGHALLSRAHSLSPDTSLVILSGDLGPGQTTQDPPPRELFGSLEKPVEKRILMQTLHSAAERHTARCNERMLRQEVEQLRKTLARDQLHLTHLEERTATRSTLPHELLCAFLDAEGIPEIGRLGVVAALDLAELEGARALLDREGVPEVIATAGRIGGTLEMQAAALQCHSVSLGRLETWHREGKVPDASSLELLAALSRIMAHAIHAQRRQRQRSALYRGGLWAILTIRAHAAPGEAGRLKRLAICTRHLAQNLTDTPGFELLRHTGFIDDLVEATSLHDIGKFAVDDAGAAGNRALSDEQNLELSRRTQLGGRALEQAAWQGHDGRAMALAIDLAHAHHERFDGSGHPQGLDGEQIPMAARIFALAARYESLVTARREAPRHAHDRACEAIHGAEYAHFDPRVIEAFRVSEGLFWSTLDTHPLEELDQDLPLASGG